MRYFAKLDSLGIVEQVTVVDDADARIPQRITRENRWVETWTRNGENKNYAGIGYYYDPWRKAFIAPKPYASWVLKETTCQWQSPIGPPPPVGGGYEWDEPLRVWRKRV